MGSGPFAVKNLPVERWGAVSGPIERKHPSRADREDRSSSGLLGWIVIRSPLAAPGWIVIKTPLSLGPAQEEPRPAPPSPRPLAAALARSLARPRRSHVDAAREAGLDDEAIAKLAQGDAPAFESGSRAGAVYDIVADLLYTRKV